MINQAINNLRASSIYEKYLLYYINERRDKGNRESKLQIENFSLKMYGSIKYQSLCFVGLHYLEGR
jgi:hypothetical protein